MTEWVEIGANGAVEECGFLGNDAKSCAQVIQADFADVYRINCDSSTWSLDKSEESQHKSGLPAPGPPHNSNWAATFDGHRYAIQDKWSVRSVPQLNNTSDSSH